MFLSVGQTMNVITPGRSSMNPLHHCLQGDLYSLEGHQGPQQAELRVPTPSQPGVAGREWSVLCPSLQEHMNTTSTLSSLP